MDEKQTRETRKRLMAKHQELIQSINRNRLAAEQISLEKTEDEGDLATINHNKDILYHLHESDFQRLRFIEQALKALDRGQYGDCVRCGEDIDEKRLMAVPWATLCIRCQEEAEKEQTLSDLVPAGLDEEMEL
jgi:RNA polymerase-binding transcription factor